jgi:hypothetical protein
MKNLKTPWGFIRANGHLVATTTSAERAHRAELGETAIKLLSALGIRTDQLEEIHSADIDQPGPLLAKLEEVRTGCSNGHREQLELPLEGVSQ